MKKFISCFFLLVLFCLSSCSGGSGAGTPTEPNTPPESGEPAESSSADTTEEETTGETTEEDFEFTIDPDRQDLPTLAVLSQIREGMTEKEVYEIAGNPQKVVYLQTPVTPTTSTAMQLPWYVYNSADGDLALLHYSRTTSDPISRVQYVLTMPQEDDFSAKYYWDAQFPPPLDPDRQDLPTYEELCTLEAGMTLEEVYAIAGFPQRIVTFNRKPSTDGTIQYMLIGREPRWYIFESSDGGLVVLRWKNDFRNTVLHVERIPKHQDDDLFDDEVQHLPTNSDMEQICVGMPFDAVIEAIGKPHGIADGVSASGYLKWITAEGDRYVVLFSPTEEIENTDQMTASEYYRYTRVFSVSGKDLSE